MAVFQSLRNATGAVVSWHGMLRQLSRGWEHSAMYIPVFLMGLLALGTYWLVRNTPPALLPERAAAVSAEPDYYMRNFGIKTFGDAGQLKSDVTGAELRHYPQSDTLEIDRALIRSYNAEGKLTTSTGDRALISADGSQVQLIGNARVVRQAGLDAKGQTVPQLQFKGEFLHVFVNEERVKSHLPVVITRGDDQFSGNTFA
jgi:lipopolysaccharide export system protein LptC